MWTPNKKLKSVLMEDQVDTVNFCCCECRMVSGEGRTGAVSGVSTGYAQLLCEVFEKLRLCVCACIPVHMCMHTRLRVRVCSSTPVHELMPACACTQACVCVRTTACLC